MVLPAREEGPLDSGGREGLLGEVDLLIKAPAGGGRRLEGESRAQGP